MSEESTKIVKSKVNSMEDTKHIGPVNIGKHIPKLQSETMPEYGRGGGRKIITDDYDDDDVMDDPKTKVVAEIK